MFIKVLGAMILFVSSGIYGMMSAQRLEKKILQIKDLRTGLNSLKQEIYLCGVPLGKAMENAANVMTTEMKAVFLSCGKAVSKHNGVSVKDEILSRISEPEILLCSESKSVVSRWASAAGEGDRKSEYESIEYALSQLDDIISKAEEDSAKKTALYRSSGFLIGAFAVAVLL